MDMFTKEANLLSYKLYTSKLQRHKNILKQCNGYLFGTWVFEDKSTIQYFNMKQ